MNKKDAPINHTKADSVLEELQTHGGKRQNAGRKHKYGEPTKVIRVPVSLIPAIKKMLLSHK